MLAGYARPANVENPGVDENVFREPAQSLISQGYCPVIIIICDKHVAPVVSSKAVWNEFLDISEATSLCAVLVGDGHLNGNDGLVGNNDGIGGGK